MPKFRAYAKVVGSKYLGVFEAENKEQAEQMALESDEAYISVCHQCIREIDNPEVTEVELEEVAGKA